LESAPSARKRDSTSRSEPHVKEEQSRDLVEEAKIPTLKVDGILGLRSPDQAELPTRTVTWGGRESFTPTDGSSRFFPADACNDSSSSCADDEENECEEPGPASMPCPSDTADAGNDSEGSGRDESGGEPSTPSGVTNDGSRSSIQVCSTVGTGVFWTHLYLPPGVAGMKCDAFESGLVNGSAETTLLVLSVDRPVQHQILIRFRVDSLAFVLPSLPPLAEF